MKVDFINSGYRRYWKKHGKEVLRAIDRCAKRGDYVMRKDLLEFEGKLAKFVGTKYAVGVNSGTDALKLSLIALGIGRGDEVITVSHTFIASIQEIVHCGATPILIDVGEDGLMNPDLIEKAITKRTKAIMPVHLSGKVCDMTKIMKIAKKYKLFVIEDACQAMGAYWGKKQAGAIGDTGCFSFISPKLMGGMGDNGAITTNSRKLYEKLLLLRNHWNITQGALHGHQPKAPRVMGWGFNSRMDNIQAAILNVKFKYYPWILKRRAQIARMYNKGLRGIVPLPIQQKGQVYQEYIIRVPDQPTFISFMKKKGVELLVRDTTPNHKLKGLGLEHFSLPVTERIAKQVVRLPTYPELRNDEVRYVISSIQQFFKETT